MVIVDSSVWIDHLRNKNFQLVNLLETNFVFLHPFILGELSCGNLKNRNEFLFYLNLLPKMTEASHNEVISFIENNKLYGKGIGWIDAHLLVSTMISKGRLFTLDKKLSAIAAKFYINFS